jgi:hypothetical protein
MCETQRVLAAVLLCTSLLRAQSTQPAKSEPMIEIRMADLEAEIGRLMQKRVDNTTGVVSELEIRIDARLVARWLLARASDAPAGSDLRHAAWIRAGDVMAAITGVEKEIDAGNRAAGPNPVAAKALNDVTFKLNDMKSPEQMDSVCRTTAIAMLPSAEAGAGADRLPPMRPPVKVDAPGGRTAETLAARARELAVSPTLRAQLLALSQLAVQISKDPVRQKELPAVRAILDDGVALAEGLQVNTAVEREDRVQMEAQVAQGLAMALDSRTRELGQHRVAALGQYRALLTRVHDMKLSPELMKRFGAALTWAQQNPKESDELVEAMELFLVQNARLAGIPAKVELPALYAKPAEDARRRAVAARDAFIEAASSATYFRKPVNLRRQAEILHRAMDGRAVIARMPEIMKVIGALRPKPFGGIDKRVQSALAAWQPDTREPDRDVATLFMTQLGRLAEYAATNAANEAISGKYTGGALESFRARRKVVLSEVANLAAAGNPLDDAAMAPLETAQTLINSAKLGMRAEEAAARADVLQRWVDWGVGPEQVESLLMPYREAMAAAFKGYAESDLLQMEQWQETRKRYEPALKLLARIAERAEECRALPSGRQGAAAKLATPVVGQPYGGARAARFHLDSWFQAFTAKEDKRVEAALEALGTLQAE